jgi:hypothetical protein
VGLRSLSGKKLSRGGLVSEMMQGDGSFALVNFWK